MNIIIIRIHSSIDFLVPAPNFPIDSRSNNTIDFRKVENKNNREPLR